MGLFLLGPTDPERRSSASLCSQHALLAAVQRILSAVSSAPYFTLLDDDDDGTPTKERMEMKNLGIHRLSTHRMGNHLPRQPGRSSANPLHRNHGRRHGWIDAAFSPLRPPRNLLARFARHRTDHDLSSWRWSTKPVSTSPGFMNVTVLRCHVLDGYDNLPLGGLRNACHPAHRSKKEDVSAMKLAR
jgi:hypothetical protein